MGLQKNILTRTIPEHVNSKIPLLLVFSTVGIVVVALANYVLQCLCRTHCPSLFTHETLMIIIMSCTQLYHFEACQISPIPSISLLINPRAA